MDSGEEGRGRRGMEDEGGRAGEAIGTDLEELVEEEGEPVGQHLLGYRLRPDRQEERNSTLG